jgi:hypothetical protein
MKDIADQEIIDLEDMDVEAFNEFAREQGWSDPSRRCHRARSCRLCKRWPPTR